MIGSRSQVNEKLALNLTPRVMFFGLCRVTLRDVFFYSQIFIQHLLHVRHCSKNWG